MLQWLRDNLKTFAWTLWLVIIAFILLYIPSFLEPSPDAADAIATVGGEVVSKEEFRRRYQFLEQSYKQQLGEQATPELLRQFQLPLQVANSLIDERLLAMEARDMGLTVSDAELSKAILAQPVFLNPDGSFIGDELYRQLLRNNGFRTAAVYEKGLRSDLLLQKVRTVLAQNVFIPDGEVERSYREQVERAKVRYLQLPRAQFAAAVEVSDQEVAAYYQEHQAEYRNPERRAISYLLIDLPRLRPQIEVDPAAVRAYYDSHQDEFTTEERVRASHILLRADDDEEAADAERRLLALKRRIEGGEDFAAVARESSEDTGSAAKGGDLNFFPRGQMVPAFEEAAFNAEVGELVGPVRTDFGVHLIRVTSHTPGGVTPFEQASNGIRFRLQTERAEPEAETRARAVAARLASEKLTTDAQWQALAEEADELSFGSPPEFASTGAVASLGQVPTLNAAVFAAEKGTVTEPIKAPRGWVIARLNEILEPSIPELSEVEARVRNALIRDRQQELAMERLRAAKGQLAGGQELEAVASGLGLEVQESSEFARGVPVQELGTASAAISQAAFTMVEGEVGGPYADAQGAMLFEVVERKQWDPTEFEENKEQTREELENAEVQRLVNALLQKKRLELDASFTRSFITDFELDSGQTEG